jgi:iron complex outermembrane receptor protein
MRTGDYATPIGTIHNSGTEMKNLRFGLGHYSAGKAVSFGYDMQDGRYGVPAGPEQGDGHGYGHEEDVELAFRRHQFRFNGSLRNLGPSFEQFNLKLNYSDWNHRELEGGKIGTEFYNKQFIYRGELQQRRCGRLSGSLGFWGLARDFRTEGEETLTPPVTHNAFALFALEQIDLERLRLQFGGRFERNSYDPDGVRKRSFNGLSASAGANFALWSGGAVVSNFTHSYRAPALEELYNNGPHPGNSAFEIGNASLRSEISNGLDFALRHQGRRFRGEANLFAYGIKRFVYGAPTGQIEDGLPELEYEQGDARFTGVEMRTSAQVHSKLWLNLGVDAVRARLPLANQPLPRIPPARGRVGLDFLHKGLSVRPELVLTRQQNAIFLTETRTPGYVLPNLVASYSLARRHALHVVTVNVFNVGNVLYRNHLSLIKAFAPEIGRGVRVSYNVHFF